MPARSLLTSLLLAALQQPAAALSTPCRWQLRASVGRTKGMTTSMPDAWGKSGNCLPITVDVDVFGTPAGEKDERVGAGAAKLEPLRSEISITGFGGAAAWSNCSLASAPARLLCLLRVRLAALGSSVRPGRGRPAGRPATASGAPASRLQKSPIPPL